MEKSNIEDFYLCKAADTYCIYNVGCPQKPFVEPLRINETGAVIFEKLSQGESVENICKGFCENYGISYEEAYADVKKFCEQLLDFGLLITL